MSLVRLYCPDLQAGTLTLSADESGHAIKSLRLGRGDLVALFDGTGREATAEITATAARSLAVRVEKVIERPFDQAHRLTIAVAMVKAHRQSYLVEKCTELGVFAIWPMVTERTVVKPREAAVERWFRRGVEAAKQSGRAWVPVVEKPKPMDEVIAAGTEFSAIVLADVDPSVRPLTDALRPVPSGGTILALIGPEGGFSERERQAAFRAGAKTVSLSRTVLRVETAAVAVCAAVAMASIERGDGGETTG